MNANASHRSPTRNWDHRNSILRNQTSLPMFLAVAVCLTLLCNFTLRENTAQASRPVKAFMNLDEAQSHLRAHPDDPEVHSRLADLYTARQEYRRALFHLMESNRLIELGLD